jgi:transketolase
MRTQSKKYAGKISKTYRAEWYFFNYPSMTNEEVAIRLSEEISKTSKNTVEVYRTNWTKKLNNYINKHPEVTSEVKQIITSEDFKNSLLFAHVKISEELSKRTNSFEDDRVERLFKTTNKFAGVDNVE